ncbi:MAG: polyprenyl synthetase family protein [Pseudomonadota bacterium]
MSDIIATEAEFLTTLSDSADGFENTLAVALSADRHPDEIARPKRLMAAMRHSALGGGKRLRPFLFQQSASLFDLPSDPSQAACALELIHCYSLVHDDLPAMDDDDLRRGKPTVHIAYDEATAILAGDSLLTLAFDLMARETTHPDAVTRVRLVQLLATASGVGGMAGGQMFDLMAETRTPDEEEVRQLQAMKTGALLRFACEGGALFGGAEAADQAAMRRFGELLGAAFQLADDLLDLTADSATMGKATGKDAAAGKGTLVDLLGEAAARVELSRLVEQAMDCLGAFGPKAALLRRTALYVASRNH